MTDAQKLNTLVPAVKDLLEAVHKLGMSKAEVNVQTKAAWIGELLGDGANGIYRVSIVEAVSEEDRLDHAENHPVDLDGGDRGKLQQSHPSSYSM